jgi:molybdopterin converting factor small subunit
MKILFFGALSEIVGQAQIEITEISAMPLDSDSLQLSWQESYPAFANVFYRIAVNKQVINENTTLSPSDEIAFLPSFSGG